MTSEAKPFAAVTRPRSNATSASWLRRAGVPAVQVVILAAVLGMWQLGADAHLVNGQLFGTPAGILEAARRTIADGSLFTDTGLTVYETLSGFILGTLLGSVVGLALWYSRFVARVVEPAAVAFNGVPKIALGPLLIIWLGAGTESKIVLAFVSTFVVALLASYGATREVDRDLVTLLRSVGASRWQIFRKLLVPSAMPTMFAAMRINVGFALVGAVVGEFISSQHGIGHAVFVAGNLFDLNTVWLGIVVLSLDAAVMYNCLAFAERILVKGRT
jgi:NitT/TauT family transport system permease protein